MRRMSFLSVIAHKFSNYCYCSSLASQANLEQKKPEIKLRHVDLIHDFIGGKKDRIRTTLSRSLNMRIQLQDEKLILQKLKIMQEMMLNDQNSVKIIGLLNYHSQVLKERYILLREYGIVPYKISTTQIRRCLGIFRSSVAELKGKNLIRKDYNVLKNLWEIARLDLDTCPDVSESCTINELKIMTFKEYLKQHLDCSVEDLTTPEDEIMQRLKNKSFKTINRNLDIFLNIICLSKARLANNWFVLYNEPERTLELLYKVKEIAHVDMKTILHVCPKIACMDAGNAEAIVKYIEAENIPIKYALRILELFTLSAETVRARLEEIKNEEFFRLNIKNPKILQVVHFLIKAKKRLAILEELRVNPTLSSLTGGQDFFEKYCEETGTRPANSDTLNYINAELNIDKSKFISIMKKHRRWNYVPIIHVGRNLQTLRERFSDEEIKKYIYVLFYYSGKLNRELEALEYHDGLEDLKEDGSVKKEYVLPLVLYYLERESNFTGESIWDPEEQNPYEDLPDMPVNFASHVNGANRL